MPKRHGRADAFARDTLAWRRSSLGLRLRGEKLKQSRYSFSETEVKQYFTEARVLQGLFGILETLFEVAIHPTSRRSGTERRFYRIERRGADGVPALVGQFYLESVRAAGKRPGAWMGGARDRWRRPGGALQTPIATIVCNFAAPLAGSSALLTHDDVLTLFHEFGHGLHLMLTQVDELGVSGLSGVEWDAVELPSQFMENFAWEWEVLKRLSAHVDTGEPLPRAV